MKEEIVTYINDPKQLEKLYRTNKSNFKQAFNELYPELKGNTVADFWDERLNYESETVNWGTGKELVFVIIASIVAGLIAKLPALLSINEDFFYPRNIGFIVFPALMAYFAWKNKLSTGKIAFIVCATLASAIFINYLPDVKTSDTLILSCIHLVLFLGSVLCFTFVGDYKNIEDKRLGFLKYLGDLVVMTGLIGIAGGLMTALTINLFLLIGIHIETFYFNYIGVFGASAAPLVATYLIQTNPQLVGKISPVIAKLFSPLVLVMLVVYLIAIIYSAKNPYNDREFLLIFNALLVGVMALIFFSVAETNQSTKSNTQIWILFFLSVVTIIVNGVAFSAIIFRIVQWGVTPNRVAVLGSNALILINLLLVTFQLYKAAQRKVNISAVGKTIAYYLPIYLVWAIIVTFIFPFLFGFK